MKVTSSLTSSALQGKSSSRLETIKWIKFAPNLHPRKVLKPKYGKTYWFVLNRIGFLIIIIKGSSHADIKKLYCLTSDKHISNEIIEGRKDFTNLQNHVTKDLSPRHFGKKDKNQCGITLWN